MSKTNISNQDVLRTPAELMAAIKQTHRPECLWRQCVEKHGGFGEAIRSGEMSDEKTPCRCGGIHGIQLAWSTQPDYESADDSAKDIPTFCLFFGSLGWFAGYLLAPLIVGFRAAVKQHQDKYNLK